MTLGCRQARVEHGGWHALETGDAALNLAGTPKSFQDDLSVIMKQWQLLTADKENAPQALTKADSDRLTRIRNCTRALAKLTHALPPSLCPMASFLAPSPGLASSHRTTCSARRIVQQSGLSERDCKERQPKPGPQRREKRDCTA